MKNFNPKEMNCNCGYRWIPSLHEKLIMLIKGRYVKTCPCCQCSIELRLVYHVVVLSRKDNLCRDIWKRG